MFRTSIQLLKLFIQFDFHQVFSNHETRLNVGFVLLLLLFLPPFYFFVNISGLLLTKDGEINDLQTKVAEVMALVPSTSGFGAMCTDTPPHFSAAFTSHNMMGSGVVLSKSNLNPNASDYQPKVSM